MNIRQIEANMEALMGSWSKDTFIYEFMLAYGLPKSTVTRAMKGTANLSKEPGVVQLKSKVLFKPIQGQDLYTSVEQLAKQATHNERFVIVTDFKNLLAKDMSGKATPLETPFDELHKHYAYFLPWAGLEKTAVINENPADRKAAEKLARLYDDLKDSNNVESDKERHALNVFLTRLLFCFFAEDTGILEDGQFTFNVGSHTAADGGDTSNYLKRLFRIMGTPDDRRESLPQHLAAFPFVGDSLFGDDFPVPDISRKGRSIILESGNLDWASINPDIFGSMIQAVVSEEDREQLGMHYTSRTNILKVIGPLFLDDLHDEFNRAQGSIKRLKKLLQRIHELHIFDPACGSGNFLIISYKELRRLEIEILKQLKVLPISGIRLDHFHGIEIDDFAHETAKLSMWLAEHQMNREFEETMGRSIPSLPLITTARIICGNAAALDWEEHFSVIWGENYIIGNPPYVGSRKQKANHKKDLASVLGHIKKYKSLDYVSIWFYKAAAFARLRNSKCAFVATKTVVQGEQVAILWPVVLKEDFCIHFAHKPFRWSNNAKGNAGVVCVIIGFGLKSKKEKVLFNAGRKQVVPEINYYLQEGPASVYASKRSEQISGLSKMGIGTMLIDGGEYLFSQDEMTEFIRREPGAAVYFSGWVGGQELLNGARRFLLKVHEIPDLELAKLPLIQEKMRKVSERRKKSSLASTRRLGDFPTKFQKSVFPVEHFLAIPETSSGRRQYIPIAFLSPENVPSNRLNVIEHGDVKSFALLTSRMHVTWVVAVSGTLGEGFSYSVGLSYNTFPFPSISKEKEEDLVMCALRILETREKYPNLTLAELYDPESMPSDLLEAHKLNDQAIERCYRPRPFESDEDRLQVLFDLYAKMTAEEANKGSLFESSKTKKKRKRHA